MDSITRITKKPQFQIGLLLLLLASQIVGTRLGCEPHVPSIQPESLKQVTSPPIPHSGQATEPADNTGAADEGAQESVTRVTGPSSTQLETSSQDPSTSNHEPPCSSISGTSVPVCLICLEDIERPTSTAAHEQPDTADIENQLTSRNGAQIENEHVVTVSNHQYPNILTRTDETSHKIPVPNTNVELPCSHLFHEKCIKGWFTKKKSRSCPICRRTGTLAIPDPTFLTWCRQMRERARHGIITPVANRYILYERSFLLTMMGTTMDRVLSDDQSLTRFQNRQESIRSFLTMMPLLLIVFLIIARLFL